MTCSVVFLIFNEKFESLRDGYFGSTICDPCSYSKSEIIVGKLFVLGVKFYKDFSPVISFAGYKAFRGVY
jgi:hypothetical protein